MSARLAVACLVGFTASCGSAGAPLDALPPLTHALAVQLHAVDNPVKGGIAKFTVQLPAAEVLDAQLLIDGKVFAELPTLGSGFELDVSAVARGIHLFVLRVRTPYGTMSSGVSVTLEGGVVDGAQGPSS